MRYITIGSLVVLFLLAPLRVSSESRPKVGLVLAGGGARGFAHIGVLKVLEEENIPIDYIVGTSMGSIIGAFYAIGYSPEEIRTISREQDWEFILSDDIEREYLSFFDKNEIDRYVVSFPLFEEEKIFSIPGGIVQGHNVLNLFCHLTTDVHNIKDFSKLHIPFACVASNLETGGEYIIKKGYLPVALSSSMAIPTVFAPVTIDDSLLVDGGITNNFPVDVAQEMGADILIGVDLDPGLLKRDKLQSIGGVLNQLITFMGYDKREDNRQMLDLNIIPDLTGYSPASFTQTAVDTLAQRGYNAADSMRTQLAAIRQQLGIKNPTSPQHTYSKQEIFYIKKIVIEGAKPESQDYILTKFHYSAPDTLSLAHIKEGINRIYGTRNFSKVYYRLTGDDWKTLTLYTEEKSISALNAGFSYNTNDKAAILLNATWSNRQSDGARASVDLILSANPEFRSSLQFKRKNLPEIGLDLGYKYFTIDVWDRDKKTITSDTDYIHSDLYLFGVVKNNLMTGFGGRGEYFKLAPLFSTPGDETTVKSSTSFYSLYGFFRYDNFDDRYVPTHGALVDVELNIGYDPDMTTSFRDVIYSAYVKAQWARSISSRICLLPAFYSRMVLSDHYPEIKTNMMGATHHNPYFRETMPFIGVRRIIPLKEYAAIGRFDVRVQLAKRHYISLLANLAFHSQAIDATANFQSIIGGGLLYTYNSLVGPVEVYLSASDYHSGVRGFVNFGYWF